MHHSEFNLVVLWYSVVADLVAMPNSEIYELDILPAWLQPWHLPWLLAETNDGRRHTSRGKLLWVIVVYLYCVYMQIGCTFLIYMCHSRIRGSCSLKEISYTLMKVLVPPCRILQQPEDLEDLGLWPGPCRHFASTHFRMAF